MTYDMKLSTRTHALFALGITAALAAGCVGGVDDPQASAESAITTCSGGSLPARVGTAYSYTSSGTRFYWTIYRDPTRTQVAYRNETVSGSWSAVGTVNRWSTCPAPGEAVQVINSGNGQSTSCTHLCLPDGREELNCPTAQIELSRVVDLNVCVATRKGLTPATGARNTCDRAIGCLDGSTCATCCAATARSDDGVVDPIEATGCDIVCASAGGDVGTPNCGDPFPPGGGSDDATTCVALAGYPGWCNMAF